MENAKRKRRLRGIKVQFLGGQNYWLVLCWHACVCTITGLALVALSSEKPLAIQGNHLQWYTGCIASANRRPSLLHSTVSNVPFNAALG